MCFFELFLFMVGEIAELHEVLTVDSILSEECHWCLLRLDDNLLKWCA